MVLGAVLGLLLVTLFLIHLGLEIMTAVTVAGLMVVVIWLVALKKRPAYPQALQEGWQSYIRQGMLSGAKLAPSSLPLAIFPMPLTARRWR